MNNILSGAIFSAIIGAITTPSPLSAAQIISTETVADKVRKLTVRNDDGITTEPFEICVQDKTRWFEAQGNPDGTRSLTEKDRAESQAYYAEILEHRRRQARDDRRAE